MFQSHCHKVGQLDSPWSCGRMAYVHASSPNHPNPSPEAPGGPWPTWPWPLAWRAPWLRVQPSAQPRPWAQPSAQLWRAERRQRRRRRSRLENLAGGQRGDRHKAEARMANRALLCWHVLGSLQSRHRSSDSLAGAWEAPTA